ncbi:FAD-binding protein [Klebsiella pneumoniae]|nr:FAD-binding protein [Klebsiella pneumoniae]
METRDKVSAAIIALPEHYAYIASTNMCGRKQKLLTSTSPKACHQRQLTAGTGGETGMDYHALSPPSGVLQRGGGKQHDEQFGRTHQRCAPGLTKARSTPFASHPGCTKRGGVTINTDGEVLNAAQQPICGAYAAGEVVGGSTAATVSAVTRWRISSSSVPCGHQAAKRQR